MSGELQLTGLDRVVSPEAPEPLPPPKSRWPGLGWKRLKLPFRSRGAAPDARPPLVGTTGRPAPLGTDPASASEPPRKKTWREKRWERRRRRRVGEEILGWILVPIILASLYWATKTGLAAFGTSPTALIQGIKSAFGSRF